MSDKNVYTLSEEEKREVDNMRQGYFAITHIHRSDLKNAGFNVKDVSDDTMRNLASRMADDYCEQLFHSSMEIIAEERFNIPKKRRNKNVRKR
jgi:hypothetical protein